MQHQHQQQRLQQQQQYYASQPTQAVQGRPRGNTNGKGKRPGFASRATMVFGVFQIIFGGICVILGITAIVIECHLREFGTGIWCGVMFALAGSFGMAASLKKTNAMIITTMVLSIISATVAGSAFIIGIFAALFEEQCYYDYDYHYDDFGNRVRDDDSYDCDTYYAGRVAVDSILVVVALAELVFAILQSAFCCGAYCCNQKPSASMMYVAVRTSEGGSQGFPMGVIQSEPKQQLAPSGVEFVQHYPDRQQQAYVLNMHPVVTSNQQPRIQQDPQPGVVYQQGQGQQLQRQQQQVQQRQQILQLQPQQLQHQLIQPGATHQQTLRQQLPQQHCQQVPHLQSQQLQYQPKQTLQSGTVDQQQQGWRESQPQPKAPLGPPKQPEGKTTGPNVNVNQGQVQLPSSSSSVREDMSAGLVENEVPLA